MRIIAGKHRGTQLANVGGGDAGAHLRPTSDRVRENLFNVLQGGRFGDPITATRVLDLFAGTGALGLEALSRGAAQATFIDNGRAALALLKANMAKLQRQNDCTVLAKNATELPEAKDQFGLVFLDPPYAKGLGALALKSAKSQGWIAPNALIVWEEAQPQIAPPGFQQLDQRRYGQTWITLLKASA